MLVKMQRQMTSLKKISKDGSMITKGNEIIDITKRGLLKNDNAFGWVTQTPQRRPTPNQHSCIIQKKKKRRNSRIDPIVNLVEN
jgi:hypothetical protein